MNILEVFKQFPTQESCVKYLEKVRWGGEIRCPYCTSTNTAKADHRHRCYTCKTSFSVTVGTIFHRTHLPLQKWFLAIVLMLNAKKGISALQLSRDLKVNKNTAWRMNMQIRKAMNQVEHRNLLQGIVEMDETYIGGKPRKGTKGDGKDGKHKPGRGTKKAPVIGAVQREGDVVAKTVEAKNMKGRNMRAFIRQHVNTEKSSLYTDEYKAYMGMSKVLPHSVIRHSDWYVDGDIHTNTIESFWALLKRGMFGQFHSVSRRHLQRYVDEFCYRYNLRNASSQLAFNLTINRALGV
jgi:transposase-like protein